MRIIHAAIFNTLRNAEDFYSTDRKFSLGLTRLGHFVVDYSYRDLARYLSPIKSQRFGVGRMNDHLFQTIDNLQPDLLLLGHSELINGHSLKRIHQQFPDMKIAMWYVDPLYIRDDYLEKLKFVNAFFATTAGQHLEALQQYTDGKVVFMPNICDASVENLRGFENPAPNIDLSFIGVPSNSTRDRTAFVERITHDFSHINFQVFGQTRETRVRGVDYLNTIFDSKLSLSLNRINDQPMYTSDRLIHLTGNGTAVISPEVPDLRLLFSDDEIIYYHDAPDLVEKVHYYLARPEERMAIAEAGHAKVHRSYNSTRVSQYILETIFDNEYGESYEWLV